MTFSRSAVHMYYYNPAMSNKKRNAKKKFKKAARPRPTLSPQHNIRLQQGVQAQSSGNLEMAESIYRSLIADRARVPQLFYNLALICAQSSRDREARALWTKSLSMDPGFFEARMQLAGSYQNAGEMDQAMEHYRKADRARPGMAAPKYLLGNLLKAQGKLQEAADLYQQVMAKHPDYTQAHFTFSGLHKYRDESDPHIATMLGLYRGSRLQNDARIQLAFSLAKAFEDIGNFPRAFEFLKAGNDLRSEKYRYSIDGDKALFENTMQMFSHEALERIEVNAEQSNRPIFILGMPRSGTSLVEKILSSHSQVFGAGELDYFYALAAKSFLNPSRHYQYDPVESYPVSRFEQLGKDYLEKLAQLDTQAPRVTDKLPFNFMLIGLIRKALPNARIIHCVRDARDNCLSIYKQNFATENYRFAYNLESVAQFHNIYRALMKHWHEVLPGAIYDLNYEALAQNPEPEIRKLLEACELEWEDSCLKFHKSEAVVTTASFYQVRQPMYTSSIKLWEKYGDCLQPMFDELQRG
ncbi:MAG: sulfotransferase [Gammaproteobacteria bacterium]|nr:sulfotransferase [Gammaproteobacteria bacterium]